jgi:hypothetical protein
MLRIRYPSLFEAVLPASGRRRRMRAAGAHRGSRVTAERQTDPPHYVSFYSSGVAWAWDGRVRRSVSLARLPLPATPKPPSDAAPPDHAVRHDAGRRSRSRPPPASKVRRQSVWPAAHCRFSLLSRHGARVQILCQCDVAASEKRCGGQDHRQLLERLDS